MQINDYQAEAEKTQKFIKSPAGLEGFPTQFSTTNDKIDALFEFANLAYATLGLSGEAAEIANKVKKIYRDNNGIITEEHEKMIADELGDVLWYVAAMASVLGLDMGEIAKANIEKLKSRMERNVISGSGDNR